MLTCVVAAGVAVLSISVVSVTGVCSEVGLPVGVMLERSVTESCTNTEA